MIVLVSFTNITCNNANFSITKEAFPYFQDDVTLFHKFFLIKGCTIYLVSISFPVKIFRVKSSHTRNSRWSVYIKHLIYNCKFEVFISTRKFTLIVWAIMYFSYYVLKRKYFKDILEGYATYFFLQRFIILWTCWPVYMRFLLPGTHAKRQSLMFIRTISSPRLKF